MIRGLRIPKGINVSCLRVRETIWCLLNGILHLQRIERSTTISHDNIRQFQTDRLYCQRAGNGSAEWFVGET